MTDTITQVRQALEHFTAAHVDAERKIAAAATLKLTVGSNEADRKRQAASMPAEEYAGYVLHLAEAEKEKAAAVAHVERTEKALNVLRELLQRETADVQQRAADRTFEAMTIADTTAQRYVMMPGNHRVPAEIRAHVNGLKPVAVPAGDVDDSDLPF